MAFWALSFPNSPIKPVIVGPCYLGVINLSTPSTLLAEFSDAFPVRSRWFPPYHGPQKEPLALLLARTRSIAAVGRILSSLFACATILRIQSRFFAVRYFLLCYTNYSFILSPFSSTIFLVNESPFSRQVSFSPAGPPFPFYRDLA